VQDLHWVGGPENEGVATNGDKEGAELGSLLGSVGTTVQGKVPDDEDVGNAGNGVPAPLLGGTLSTESSEEASEDHDQVGNDSHDDVSTGHASQETEIKEEQRSGQAPVNVAGPEDLAVDLGEGVGNVVVLLTDDDLVVAHTVASSHGKVRERSSDGDDGGDGVEKALRLSSGLAPSRPSVLRTRLTSGTLHDRAVNAADAMTMSTKTTHSVFLPVSPASWYSGAGGRTEGMGATSVGEAVGRGRAEVFLRASMTCSAIMMAVVDGVGA
jgi:hypothetical protein